ncbi:hypothetical protein RQP46_006610 [Phenoliferia psychrophenolica]
MSDLTALFDWENPDYSQVDIPDISMPHAVDGHFDGAEYCYATGGPLVVATPPYGLQNEADALFQEAGFKQIVLEATDPTLATGNTFKVRFTAAKGSEPAYLSSSLGLATQTAAGTFTVINQGTGTGYSLQNSAGKFVSLANRQVSLASSPSSFRLFSVTM